MPGCAALPISSTLGDCPGGIPQGKSAIRGIASYFTEISQSRWESPMMEWRLIN